MAGHSKWSNVKHIKGPLDQKRGQLFSTRSRETSVAARLLGRAGVTTESQKLTFVPETHVQLSDSDVSAQVLRSIDALEDSDDVQHVHAIFAAREEALANSVG